MLFSIYYSLQAALTISTFFITNTLDILLTILNDLVSSHNLLNRQVYYLCLLDFKFMNKGRKTENLP